jgi:hypothetical protein
MAPSAGYAAVVAYSADDGTYANILHLNAAQAKPMLEMLDTTSFDDGGDKSRIAGLREFDPGTISGDYDSADTGGQVALRAAILARTPFYLKVLPDGSTGFKCKMIGESYEIGAKVGDKTSFSFTAKSIAAPTAI